MPTTDTLYISLPIDPSTISTAQQKKFDPRTRRFFQNKKVLNGMKIITLLARHKTKQVQEFLSLTHEDSVSVTMYFLYSYPKGTAKKNRIDLRFINNGADCDNRAKAPIDALGKAEWWPDDRVISSLHLHKLRTTKSPCIVIGVKKNPLFLENTPFSF